MLLLNKTPFNLGINPFLFVICASGNFFFDTILRQFIVLFKPLEVHPGEDCEDDQENEVSLLEGKAKRAGPVQPGEETEKGPHQCTQLSEGKVLSVSL